MSVKKLFIITIVMISFVANAQNKKDIRAIQKLSGCFEVGFNFAETFNYSEDSTYRASETKQVKALEWVETVESSKKKVVLQHLLLAGPHIVKHWREDWEYQNRDFYEFNHDNQWTYVKKSKKEVKKQWSQKVFQVDDSPRYEGTATWVHVDGKSYWESTTDAPLPRREYSKRSDYNVTSRTNRIEITPWGYIHDQDNKKVIRENGEKDITLAEEKGVNTYKRVPNAKCQAAIDWWKKNHSMWKGVRASWDDVFDQKKNLSLKEKVNGKKLYQQLFSLDTNTDKAELDRIIKSYVK